MIRVTNQAELDAAIASGEAEIVLVGDGDFSIGEHDVITDGSSSPRVVARGSSSPRVVARESSSPRVVAWGSSSPRVEAWGSSSVSGFIAAYAALVASRRDTATVNIPRAVVLPEVEIRTAEEWCAFYGVEAVDGVVTLFKAVGDDFRSLYKMSYAPGSLPSAPDWNPVPECGGGLHFSPSPAAAFEFNSGATRFVACPVLVSEIVVHFPAESPQKVKAPRCCAPTWEVDLDGEPVVAPEVGSAG